MKRIRVIQVRGTTRTEYEFTPTLARELGITSNDSRRITVAYLMDGIFAWEQPVAGAEVCPSCGTTHRELLLHHRVGCETCYAVFAPTIERIRRRTVNEPLFSGRIPPRLERYRRLFVQRAQLMDRLDVAVDSEDYEAAAAFRDQLNRLASEDDG